MIDKSARVACFFGSSTTVTFRLNTVTRSGENNKEGAAVCAGGQTLESSIFYGNTHDNGANRDHQFYGCTLMGDVTEFEATGTSGIANAAFEFVNANMGDFHLKAGSANNRACCVDRAPTYPTIVRDVDGDTRPLGQGYDIGGDEVE